MIDPYVNPGAALAYLIASAIERSALELHAVTAPPAPRRPRRACPPPPPERQVITIAYTGPDRVNADAVFAALASVPANRGSTRKHPRPPAHRLAVADLLDALPVEHSTPLHPRRRCRLHCGAVPEVGPCRATGCMVCKPPLGPRPSYVR